MTTPSDRVYPQQNSNRLDVVNALPSPSGSSAEHHFLEFAQLC